MLRQVVRGSRFCIPDLAVHSYWHNNHKDVCTPAGLGTEEARSISSSNSAGLETLLFRDKRAGRDVPPQCSRNSTLLWNTNRERSRDCREIRRSGPLGKACFVRLKLCRGHESLLQAGVYRRPAGISARSVFVGERRLTFHTWYRRIDSRRLSSIEHWQERRHVTDILQATARPLAHYTDYR